MLFFPSFLFYQCVAAHYRGPFLLPADQTDAGLFFPPPLLPLKPRWPSKENALALGKSIGQTGEVDEGGVGATLLVALQEVAETHS